MRMVAQTFATLLIVIGLFMPPVFAQSGPGEAPPVDLSDVKISDKTRENLQRALVENAPGLVLVVDNEALRVAAFVASGPERLDLKQYYMVDVIPTSNGKPGKETPEGIFELNSKRMKEKDRSYTYGVEMNFTLFWKNWRNKTIDGVAFHAITRNVDPAQVGVGCTSSGCVTMLPEKAEELFREVKGHFSAQANGSDVLIVSESGSIGSIANPDEYAKRFGSTKGFQERLSAIVEQSESAAPVPRPENGLGRLKPLSGLLQKQRILIDARKPIAGNGDTASSLFLVQNFIHRGFKGKIDIVVDDKGDRILRALSKNLEGFAENIRLMRVEELDAKPYSLVIRSGQPSGRIFVENMHTTSKADPARPGHLNVTVNTKFLVFTIYGNSLNQYSLQPHSLAARDGSYYLVPSTGMDTVRSSENEIKLDAPDGRALPVAEAGIFRDPFSLAIRDWSLENIESFLLSQSELISENFRNLLRDVIQIRKAEGVPYSLAYGFSIPQVRSQARDYFRGLLSSDRPTIVLTPSAFGEGLMSMFTPEERSRLRVTTLKELAANGGKLERSHLTVVQIPNVPHQVFASLLLASQRNRIVPLGAGDGFFTTALSLGVPFAPTLVDWNVRNVRALGRALQVEALRQGMGFPHMQNLRRLYSAIPSDPVQLGHSQQLIRYTELFRNVIWQFPDLVETIDQSVRQLETKSKTNLKRIAPGTKVTHGDDNTRSGGFDEKYGGAAKCMQLFAR